jgi:hypothetical protein
MLSGHVTDSRACHAGETCMAPQYYHQRKVRQVKTGFGWIGIGGTRYDRDGIIHADARVSKRKKKASQALKSEYGYTPLPDDELDILTDEKPELVYIGPGQYGDLPTTPKTKALLV